MITQIHIINGPNLNLLGQRDPEVYGFISFATYLDELNQKYPEGLLHYFQTNHEGGIIDYLHEIGFDQGIGVILNAGGYTHTSIAIRDAIDAITAPVVEVHISNIYERESFRSVNYLKEKCIASFVGEGLEGYRKAIEHLINHS